MNTASHATAASTSASPTSARSDGIAWPGANVTNSTPDVASAAATQSRRVCRSRSTTAAISVDIAGSVPNITPASIGDASFVPQISSTV
ncbi:hypothetical protein FEP36_05860 [Burkholderia multivorans]|nr:hypothetical protein [Burkholderia multivorans]